VKLEVGFAALMAIRGIALVVWVTCADQRAGGLTGEPKNLDFAVYGLAGACTGHERNWRNETKSKFGSVRPHTREACGLGGDSEISKRPLVEDFWCGEKRFSNPSVQEGIGWRGPNVPQCANYCSRGQNHARRFLS